jgi:hypothetical protein
MTTTTTTRSSSSTPGATGQSSSVSTVASPGSGVALKNLYFLGLLCAGAIILPRYL